MTAPAVSEYRILLPITKPLSLNERLHWAAKAKRTREIRQAVALLAKTKPYRIPRLDRCTVQLEWRPRTAHRRDGDNTSPTVKAAVDGLRDAGVLDDDDTSRVTHLPVVILPPVPREPARLWLVVRPLELEETA
jgi:crossover junction endodeoxyribonuclease RusA